MMKRFNIKSSIWSILLGNINYEWFIMFSITENVAKFIILQRNLHTRKLTHMATQLVNGFKHKKFSRKF